MIKNISKRDRISIPVKPLQWARNISEAIEPVFIWASKIDSKKLTQFAIKLHQYVESIPSNTKKTVIYLAERGWFLTNDFSIADFDKLQEYTGNNDDKAINSFMKSEIDNALNNIQDRISQRFPLRANIIADALNAHRLKQFTLSVPILLIQSEGITIDIFNERKLFSTHDKYGISIKFIESLPKYNIYTDFLECLKTNGGIRAQEKDRPKYPYAPNQHEILHGKDTGYGKHINSCKAISLLGYCVDTLPKFSTKLLVEKRAIE